MQKMLKLFVFVSLSLSLLLVIFMQNLTFCDQPAYFTMTRASVEPGIYRWIFHDPHGVASGNDKFFMCGINNMMWLYYRLANGQTNGDYNNYFDWAKDQVKHLFKWNINALGWWCGKNMYDEDKPFWNGTQYTNENFWEHVSFYKDLNNYLPQYHNQFPQIYPKAYFPFIVNVDIIPSYQAHKDSQPGAGSFKYLPDAQKETGSTVWNGGNYDCNSW